MADALIQREDLDRRIGAASVTRFADDDGDGVADKEVLAAVIEEATGYAISILSVAWTKSEIVELARDRRIVGALADIAIGLLAERRPEWQHPQTGRHPYAERMKRGVEALRAIASGQERLGREEDVGPNATLAGEVSVATPIEHVFSPSRTKPGGVGGF